MNERLPTGPESLPPPHRRLGMRALDTFAVLISTVLQSGERKHKKEKELPKHLADPVYVGLAQELGFKSFYASPSENRLTIADIVHMNDEDIETLRKHHDKPPRSAL